MSLFMAVAAVIALIGLRGGVQHPTGDEAPAAAGAAGDTAAAAQPDR